MKTFGENQFVQDQNYVLITLSIIFYSKCLLKMAAVVIKTLLFLFCDSPTVCIINCKACNSGYIEEFFNLNLSIFTTVTVFYCITEKVKGTTCLYRIILVKPRLT